MFAAPVREWRGGIVAISIVRNGVKTAWAAGVAHTRVVHRVPKASHPSRLGGQFWKQSYEKTTQILPLFLIKVVSEFGARLSQQLAVDVGR